MPYDQCCWGRLNNNNDYDSFTLEDFIDIREEKTYIAYKINKHFNDLKKETQILLPLRLLLPENRYCHPNLELEDFKTERENRWFILHYQVFILILI